MKARVSFPTRGRSVRVARDMTLLEAVRDAGLPIARGCAGEGLCGRCGVEIVEGRAGIAAERPDEARAKERNRVAPELRLACRVRVDGDLAISAPYW